MKSKMLALLAIALVAAASPAMIALASGVSQAAAHAHHPTGPGNAECTFTHPTSLPSQASPNATDALADRSSHCPPTIPAQ